MSLHEQLTVVSVYGHGDGSLTLPAMTKSLSELPGSRGLLLSIQEPREMPANVQWRKIYPLDYRSYSTFMMHCLYAFIETDYCLVIQDDGWVLDGNNWKDEYYDYDYIGGITHAGMTGNQIHLHFTWVYKQHPILVLNGGFSLRSKRFLEAPNKHGIAQIFSTDIHIWNEDIQLSCIRRELLESLGYKIAPDDVAKEFSLEHIAPVFHDDLDFSKLLGHHSTTRKLIAPEQINITRDVGGYYRETEFLSFLSEKGYTLNDIWRK